MRARPLNLDTNYSVPEDRYTVTSEVNGSTVLDV